MNKAFNPTLSSPIGRGYGDKDLGTPSPLKAREITLGGDDNPELLSLLNLMLIWPNVFREHSLFAQN